jgi:hypothetical protein
MLRCTQHDKMRIKTVGCCHPECSEGTLKRVNECRIMSQYRLVKSQAVFTNGNFRKDNLKIRKSQTADFQNTKKSYIEVTGSFYKPIVHLSLFRNNETGRRGIVGCLTKQH